MIRQYENGQTILHEITNTNRAATYLGRNDFSLSGGSSSSNNQSVPQNGENVNNGITRLADLGYDISKDMGGKAKKALDKTADIANEHRLGGTLDTRYDSDKSIQKLEDVIEGKTSFDDYMNEQRELMWQSFKDSNRGTESFLHKDENGNFDRRDTVSNNGTLYRQLYEEYGGRPTKAAFNEALDDVLANGQNSKYYDGFREFDHDGERSVFGFNQGNEDIDTILDLKDDLGATIRTFDQQRFDAQTPKGEVGSIEEVINTPSGKNSFVTLLKGVNNKVRDVIKKAIGVDVAGYNHVMDSSSINHALNRHANDAVPLKVEDFNLVPDIIKNADNIEYVGKNRKGLDVIRYTKQYDNQIAYLEEVRNGRHQLATDTMYWARKGQQKSGPTGESSAINATDSLRALPRPAGDTNQSVSQTTENVNGRSYEKETGNLPEDFDVKHYVTDQTKAQKNGGTPSITPSRRTNVALEGSASNDSIVPQDNTNVNGRGYEKETENLPEDFDETPTVGPTQQKNRLSGESSVSDTTDSLRALSRSGEIGNNHILT